MENENEEVIASQNNDEVVEETEETTDVVEESENDTDLTVEDYNKLKQENKKLYERAKKAEALAKAKKEATLIKTNETQSGLTREEAIMFAKGYTEADVELANKLSKINGTNLLVALEDEIFKSKVEARRKKEQSEKASLSPSAGTGKFKAPKPVGDMTEDEHRAYFNKVMGN